MDNLKTDVPGYVPYDIIDIFYHCLCDYKDVLDGQPYDSNNLLDSFVKTVKCETCDTIFTMFCDIMFKDYVDDEVVSYTFKPFDSDHFLKRFISEYKVDLSSVNLDKK